MDTTYFRRSFGVMVLIDSISGKALSVSEVKYETNEQYFTAIGSLKDKGIEIQRIVRNGDAVWYRCFLIFPYSSVNFIRLKPLAAI